MEVFLVGGAVRDELLGLPVKERDWVVIGSSPEEMVKQGFKPVGKDFPVFLHPESHEEYALARTERKSGKGYYGFEIFTSPDVTLEEDLLRRDLTINAIAKAKNGEIIDPYHGQQDLYKKLLRHVSSAFTEDPLRVLRVARFASKLNSQGFQIAEETLALMRKITLSGELNTLPKERIWSETKRALSTDDPGIFFSVLEKINALEQSHNAINHAFSSSKASGLKTLNLISKQTQDPCIRFAAFLGGLFNYNRRVSSSIVSDISTQLTLSNDCKDLISHTLNLQHRVEKALELNANDLLNLVQKLDARRKPERFKNLLKIFTVIYTAIHDTQEYPQVTWINKISQEIENIDIESWVNSGYSHQELGNLLKTSRLDIINKLISEAR